MRIIQPLTGTSTLSCNKFRVVLLSINNYMFTQDILNSIRTDFPSGLSQEIPERHFMFIRSAVHTSKNSFSPTHAILLSKLKVRCSPPLAIEFIHRQKSTRLPTSCSAWDISTICPNDTIIVAQRETSLTTTRNRSRDGWQPQKRKGGLGPPFRLFFSL